ncbi:MAG: glycosyl transferase family 2 [Leptolyngbya sp.]|nr:MAG: glycosyl transferase family 2 [Leptolyngbya sp.]
MNEHIVEYKSYPFVSVIIPVFNDFERLCLCLKSLERQSYPKELYEVIVVDNKSVKDPSKELKDFSWIHLLIEEKPGSYAARNRGINSAKGDIVAFTDSDCIPCDSWLQNGVQSLLKSPKYGVAAGKIEIFFKNSQRPNLVEIYDSVTFLQQEKYVQKYNSAATANLFTHRKFFDELGFFDDTLKSGGDGEWSKRVSNAGYLVIYAEDSSVMHPARYMFKDLRRKIARVTGGFHTMENQYSRNKILLLLKLLLQLRPPLRSGYKKTQEQDILNSFAHKVSFLLIFSLVHYVTVLEKIRLVLGGETVR